VSTEGVKYPDIIDKPMDYHTIRTKLDANTIDSPESFAADVRLVFDNAVKFTPSPLSVVHEYACTHRKIFENAYHKAGLATDHGAAAAAATLGTELDRCAKLFTAMYKWPEMYQMGQMIIDLDTVEDKLLHPIEYENAASFAQDVNSLFDDCCSSSKLVQARAKFENAFYKLQLSTDEGAAAAAAAAAMKSTAAGKKRKLM